MLCLPKKSLPICRVVASEATALAPFSQNSETARWSSGSGQAQLGQSKPSVWLSSSKALVPRTGPAVFITCLRADATAGVPPACDLAFFCLGG